MPIHKGKPMKRRPGSRSGNGSSLGLRSLMEHYNGAPTLDGVTTNVVRFTSSTIIRMASVTDSVSGSFSTGLIINPGTLVDSHRTASSIASDVITWSAAITVPTYIDLDSDFSSYRITAITVKASPIMAALSNGGAVSIKEFESDSAAPSQSLYFDDIAPRMEYQSVRTGFTWICHPADAISAGKFNQIPEAFADDNSHNGWRRIQIRLEGLDATGKGMYEVEIIRHLELTPKSDRFASRIARPNPPRNTARGDALDMVRYHAQTQHADYKSGNHDMFDHIANMVKGAAETVGGNVLNVAASEGAKLLDKLGGEVSSAMGSSVTRAMSWLGNEAFSLLPEAAVAI